MLDKQDEARIKEIENAVNALSDETQRLKSEVEEIKERFNGLVSIVESQEERLRARKR